MIPPVSGGRRGRRCRAADPAIRRAAGGSSSSARDAVRAATILAELAEPAGARRPEDGAVVGFLGRTRVDARHAGARPGGGGGPPRRPRASSRSSTRPTRRWRSGRWRRSPTRSRTRFGVDRLAIVHRTGEVPLGEASIAVVAVAPHRDAAFQAARYAIDETKARAPIWKAERFADGHVWIGHPARTGPPRRHR